MARRKRIRNFHLALRMKRKLMIVFVLVIILVAVLIGRLAFIQISSGDRYEKAVLSQQDYTSRTIPFRRGDIVDRKGTVLATSTDVYNVILDCSVIMDKEEYLEPTLDALEKCFSINRTELKSYIQEHAQNRYYILSKRIPAEQRDAFVAITDAKDKDGNQVNPNVQGVWFEKEYIRKYPYTTLAASVLGFTTAGNEGIGGLEGYYNETLNGTNGREYGYLNSDSNYETSVVEAVNGETIVSTIDVNIQSILEDKIQDFAEQYSKNEHDTDGAKNIGIIVMNPNNGEVLGMATYPGFDLTDPWSLENYYTKKQIKKMSEEERLDALNKIWQNFCVSSTFEPGSTTKPITVAAGLDSGKLKGDETYYCPGFLHVADRDIRCVNRDGHGPEDLAGSLADSCNVALMHIGMTIGPEVFSQYQQIFNIGLKTNIDLPGEARTDSVIYTEEELEKSVVNLATNAFGQNFNVTMIQVISAYNSIVNGGNYYQPHMVSKILDESGNTVQTIEPTLLRHTVSKSTSDTMVEYLKSVTTEGTGDRAKVDGYSMCGKTGTAEKLPRSAGKNLVSFEGSVPAENPQVSILCVVDEPNVRDQAHSYYAQRIVKKILKELLPYMNIQKDEPEDGSETDEE